MKTMPPTRLRERAAAIVFALGVGLGVSPCWLVGLEGVAVAAGADAATAQVLFEDGKRLAAAIVVLRDERRTLDDHAAALGELRERALATIGQTTAAAVRDLGGELRYWTTRSEVGQLDVAWAVQHAEQDEAERLERSRDQGFKELDRALDQVLEDME